MNPYETETYKGYTIAIEQDDSCESPRDSQYNVSRLFFFQSRRFTSPDKTDVREDDFETLEECIALLAEEGGEIVAWDTVAVYEHSGVTFRLGSRKQFVDWQWDTAYAGVAVVYKKDYETCCETWDDTPLHRERAEEAMKSELEEYTDWVSGNCWGYVITDPNGETVDSCWGYVGDSDGYVLDAAKYQVDYYANERDEKHALACLAGI